MPDEVTPPAGGDVTDPPTPPVPPAVAPPATPPVPVGITSAQLAERLREAESAGEKKLLKALGFEKPADLKAVLKLAKDQQDADLSEKDKLDKLVAELRPKAERAEAYEGLIAAMVDEQFAALPEAVRTSIDEAANGDPQERLRMIKVLRKSGLLNAPAAAPTVPAPAPAPAARPAPATTSPPPIAPRPNGTRTKWDEYQDLEKKNATLGAIFYEKNRVSIEQSRPSATQ